MNNNLNNKFNGDKKNNISPNKFNKNVDPAISKLNSLAGGGRYRGINNPSVNNQIEDEDIQEVDENVNEDSSEVSNNLNENNQNQGKKQTLDHKMAKFGTKVALEASGVPAPLAEMVAENELVNELGAFALKTSRRNALIVVTIFVVIIIVIVAIIMGASLNSDESDLNSNEDIIAYVKDYNDEIEFPTLVDYFVYMGICEDNDNEFVKINNCENSSTGKFFKEFKSIYKKYHNDYKDKDGNGIDLDVRLLLETVSYYRTDMELFEENMFSTARQELNDLSEAMVEQIQEKGDYYKKVTEKKCNYDGRQGKNVCEEVVTCKLQQSDKVGSTYYRISDDKYISYLKYGKVHENYSGNVKIYDVDISEDSDCSPSGHSYNPPDNSRNIYNYVTGNDTESDPDNTNDTNITDYNVTGTGKGSEIAKYALQFVGNPYVYGGESLTNGADCSGFTMSVYKHFGITLPHNSGQQSNMGTVVNGIANAIPGDLIFYGNGTTVNHVALYIGNNQVVHASTEKTGIKVSKADYRTPITIRRFVS